LNSLGIRGPGRLITDGGDALGFRSADLPAGRGELEIRGRGGFVMVVE